jgi:hypothetical protein
VIAFVMVLGSQKLEHWLLVELEIKNWHRLGR